MVDFKKKLQKAQVAKATDPKEIYATLDRTGAAGPTLRPSQEDVLDDWYANHREDKDVYPNEMMKQQSTVNNCHLWIQYE